MFRPAVFYIFYPVTMMNFDKDGPRDLMLNLVISSVKVVV